MLNAINILPKAGKSPNRLTCILLLLCIDAMACPYAGLIYDARLYAAQAMSNINPHLFSNDLYFLYGTQDAFSFFSQIHAWFIQLFNLHTGTWIFYQICRIIFYNSILSFYKSLTDNRSLAFVCSILIAAGPVHYIAFDVNDPFLTPRLLSVSLGLFALTAAFTQHTQASVLFLVFSGLIHPLMTIAPALVICIYWIYDKNFKALIRMVIAGAAALGVLFIFKDGSSHQFTAILDDTWRRIIIKDGSCLVPGLWSPADRINLIGTLLIGLLVFYLPDPKLKMCTIWASIIVLSGVIISIVSLYWTHLILPVQLQLWRTFWLLRLLVPVIGIRIWLYYGYKKYSSFTGFAALLICASIITFGGIDQGNFVWILLGWGAVITGHLFTERTDDISKNMKAPVNIPRIASLIFYVIFIFFLISLLIVVAQNILMFTDTRSVHSFLLSTASGLGPFLRPMLCILIFFGLARLFSHKMVSMILISIFFVYLTLPGMSEFVRYPEIIELDRPLKPNLKVLKNLYTWQELIPPGSVIFTDGSIPVEYIWFYLQRPGYVSRMQKGGIAFSRQLALEFDRRKRQAALFKELHTSAELERWAGNNRIQYITTRRKLPLNRIARLYNISLYSIKDGNG
jgi:hypothetical protein